MARSRGNTALQMDRSPKAEQSVTPRQREILKMVALGHTNQEIAKLLFISVRTAETHRARIMQKLQLSSRADLVRYALAHGELETQLSPTDTHATA